MKGTVIRYAALIEELTGVIRKEYMGNGHIDDAELLRTIEDRFFGSDMHMAVSFKHYVEFVDAIFVRVASKYGILKALIEDDSINEIMVNGPHDIFIERARMLEEVDDAFTSENELESIIRMFASDVHREINEANPIVDARLPNGYRINGVLSNVALNGPVLTIRKFSDEVISMDDLMSYGSITKESAEDLKALVRCGYNIFISGGTSSGKTTFLNALSYAIDENERAVIIEDSAELKIDHLKNKVQMECRNANSIGKGEVTMEKLIRTSLRMRPDRIIVGEVRGKETVDMIQAMNTGHDGSMSTGHGNSIKGMLNRLETMYLMDSSVPVTSVRSQIANAIDIFVHLMRDPSGRRKVVEIAELNGVTGEEYDLNYLYVTSGDGLIRTENGLISREKLRRGGEDDRLKQL
jgi:pilus assembly protein CpaF